MHIYCLTRGGLSSTRNFEEDLKAQYLPMEIKMKGEKKAQKIYAQLQIRPVNLYEIVCPKECEKQVMGMLKPMFTDEGYGLKIGKFVKYFRKLLGLKEPIRDFERLPIPPNEGMTIMVLGTKEDEMKWEAKPDPNQLLKDGHTPKELL